MRDQYGCPSTSGGNLPHRGRRAFSPIDVESSAITEQDFFDYVVPVALLQKIVDD